MQVAAPVEVSFLDLYTDLLSPVTSDGALALYLGGYVFLILTMASTLGCVANPSQTSAHSQVLLAIAQQARVRWFLVFTLLSLAGLPPFFFFGCKLGLLGLLLTGGTLLTNLTVAALVVLSWAVYFGAIRRLVSPVVQTTAAELRRTRLAPRQAWLLASLGGVLCFGLFIFEDAALFLINYLG
jgi:NADH:ubiquinone oxidoreductase subunit 2 (subunit N)